MNLSILHLSMPTHSLPKVVTNEEAYNNAADSLFPKLLIIEPIISANSSWTRGLSDIQKQ